MSTRKDAGTQPARRPLLILAPGRPRGSRVRARIVADAERRAIVVAALKQNDSMRSVDLIVQATQADAVIVCADAPVQALVAAVAAARDLPFSCMPAGPDDLLARDLGSPLDDPGDALSLPFSTAERTVDIAEINGVPFVNYVAVGLEMPARPTGSRRRARRQRPGQARPRPTAPPARTGRASEEPALLVCNDRFELGAEELGARDWPDGGRLQVVQFDDPDTDRAYASLRSAGFHERSAGRFQLSSRAAVHADVDGQPRRLAPPLRFRSVHAAVRVRAPAARRERTEAGPAARDAELESLGTG